MKALKYGMEGYAVKLLQYALARAGLEPGNADGIFGRRTAKALQQFQRDQGLAADGVSGKLTWAALYPYITGYTLHRITAGDTLYQLAKRYGTTMEALRTANPALDPEGLFIGSTLTIPLGFPVVTHTIPYSSLLTGLMLKGLVMRYPFLSLHEIGRSVMGRRIQAVSIGTGTKRVGYNAAHHANEWITVPLLLRFLEEYAAAFVHESFIGGLRSPQDSFYGQASALASYYRDIPFPEGWKNNIIGVDLNLQYPAGWDVARRIKFDQGYTRPGPRDYVGSAPLITPENRAMADWTKANDFSLTLSYHTQGKTIYWQYDDTAPDAQRIGEAMSQSSGYTLQSTPYESGHAGYNDWFIQTWSRPGFTIEAGRGENPLPLSQFEEIYGENLPILIRGITLSP